MVYFVTKLSYTCNINISVLNLTAGINDREAGGTADT